MILYHNFCNAVILLEHGQNFLAEISLISIIEIDKTQKRSYPLLYLRQKKGNHDVETKREYIFIYNFFIAT